MAENLQDLLDFDDDYEPLAVDDEVIDQENMDDDNPYDTVDYPTMRNMPAGKASDPVYVPERFGSVRDALASMLDYNPARRPVLLGIVELCRNGAASSAVTEYVTAFQKDNRSVYAPMTLCRMLERAGALTLEMPEVSTELEDVEEGVEYLEIKERIDPVWTATPEALELAEEFAAGSVFKDLVLVQDRKYLDVYIAVMELIAKQPSLLPQVEELVDTFPVVHEPRRFGGHFIDILEKADCIAWIDRAWRITDLGKDMLELAKKEA